MKLNILLLLVLFVFTVPSTFAQGVRSGPDPATIRDPDLERDSQHNLEVARNYFKLKKAYVAALKRCEEIIAGNPNFSKIEEVLWMAGQSSVWLSQNKGKQNPDLYVSFEGGEKRTLKSQQFLDMGKLYLNKLVTDYPNGSYSKQAQQALRELETTPKQ